MLRDVTENVEQMIPDHLYSGDVETLVGSMYEAQSGAEADHVELGITLGEEAALQSGVDATYDGILAEELLVGVDDDFL